MRGIARKAAKFAAALGFAVAAATASATPVSFDQWYEFGFGAPPGALTACSAVTCTPGVASTFVGDPAWEFVCPAGGCTLFVTDAFLSIDQFEIFDGITSLGTTTAPTSGGACDNDP